MALASILYADGSIKPIDVDKAVAAHNALTGITEPTEAQADWLCTIKRIFIPPSHRPSNYQAVYQNKPIKRSTEPENGSDKLFHPGIQQGMGMAIPENDR